MATEEKHAPGMSPAEMMEKLAEAMRKEHEAEKKAPKVFKKGEMLEEVPPNDDAHG